MIKFFKIVLKLAIFVILLKYIIVKLIRNTLGFENMLTDSYKLLIYPFIGSFEYSCVVMNEV